MAPILVSVEYLPAQLESRGGRVVAARDIHAAVPSALSSVTPEDDEIFADDRCSALEVLTQIQPFALAGLDDPIADELHVGSAAFIAEVTIRRFDQLLWIGVSNAPNDFRTRAARAEDRTGAIVLWGWRSKQ